MRNEKIKTYAYGRIGLLGNPSDIYGGKCISFTFDRKAEVCVEEYEKLIIESYGKIEDNLDYNGTHDLIKATIRHLNLENGKIKISYKTDIPIGAGLGGSSAIIIATIRAFNNYFNLGFDENNENDKKKIAELALQIEIKELGISAGFQDRYAISFGGINYFDFSGKEYLRKNDPYGIVKKLEIEEIPFFLVLGVHPKSSAIVHNPLREEFLKGGKRAKEIKANMDKIAELAEKGVEALINKEWGKLGELMNENHRLREEYNLSLEKDNEIVKKALEYGALGAKVAGSGGAVVVLTNENDKKTLEKMIHEYPCMKPRISFY